MSPSTAAILTRRISFTISGHFPESTPQNTSPITADSLAIAITCQWFSNAFRDGQFFTIRCQFRQAELSCNRSRLRRHFMAKAKSATPEGFRSLTPYLIVTGASTFLDFIQNAFDAGENYLMRDSVGIVRHAEARIGDAMIEFAEAGPGWSAMPAGLHFYVKDADDVYARALKAGGTSLYEPANRDYGDRESGVRDPAENFWFIATHTAGKSYRPEILQDLNSYFSVKDAGRFLDFLEK